MNRNDSDEEALHKKRKRMEAKAMKAMKGSEEAKATSKRRYCFGMCLDPNCRNIAIPMPMFQITAAEWQKHLEVSAAMKENVDCPRRDGADVAATNVIEVPESDVTITKVGEADDDDDDDEGSAPSTQDQWAWVPEVN